MLLTHGFSVPRDVLINCNKYIVRNFFFRKKKNPTVQINIKEQDINLLKRLSALVQCFSKASLHPRHPLHDVSREIKLKATLNSNHSFISVANAVAGAVDAMFARFQPDLVNFESPANGENALNWKYETALRIQLCKHYMLRLGKAIEDRELTLHPTVDHNAMAARLVDVCLLGSGSERISEHLQLYGQAISQQQLQESLYVLFEPEIAACTTLTQIKTLHKHHIKGIPRFSKEYLLDNLELNVKSRCLFSWSVPTFSGFKPLPDDHKLDVETILRQRRTHFSVSDKIGEQFIEDYLAKRRSYYYDREDNWETIKMGLLFLVGTCVLDIYVCVM